MLFSLLESILYTTAALVAIVILYIYMRKLNIKLVNADKNKLVFVTYTIFTLLLLILFYSCFLFWNTTIFIVIGLEWNVIIDTIGDKAGMLVSSILIFVIGLGLTRIIRLILEHSQKSESTKNAKRRKTIVKLTTSILDYSLKIIIILVVLSVWGVNVFPAIAGLGILGLVIGFGAQDLMKDFIAGFFIIFEKHFDVGDIVEINGFKGEVIDIGLKTTKVMNWKKDIKLFNNASVQNAINYSFTESMAIVEVGISYNEDIDSVITVLNEELPRMLENNPDILENPNCLGVINFSASSVDLRIIAKSKTEKQYGVERSLRKEIKKILGEKGIEIPFTQIVLHHENLKDEL